MPVKEHRCPHCGNSTTYIKDYRLQTVRDLVVLGKPYPLSRTFLREREKQQFLPEPLLLSFY